MFIKKVINYIKDDTTIWEKEPLENLAKHSELASYLHEGFGIPMDTMRDKRELEKLWKQNRAPWKRWD